MQEKLLEIPLIPKASVKTVLIDGRISNNIENNLSRLGIDIIKSPFCADVYGAIGYHPDIMIHQVNRNTFVVAPNVWDYFQNIFKQPEVSIVKGYSILARNYPSNVAYNVCRVGKFAIHNFKYTDEKLLGLLEKEGLTLINVKQGYSKCSISVVNENSIITSDRGIAKATEKYGIDVLCVSPGYILLPGMDYGFVGGISGLIDRNRLAFTGHLRKHPDYKKIENFLTKHNVEPVYLDSGTPEDVGSIIPLYEMEF